MTVARGARDTVSDAPVDADADGTVPAPELDAAALLPWLREHVASWAPATSLHARRFVAGHSNLTYLLTAGATTTSTTPTAAAAPPALVLRTAPPGAANIAAGHNMVREHSFIAALRPHYPRAPRAVAACADASSSPLQQAFTLQERVRGVIHRKDQERTLPPVPARAALCAALVEALAELHSVDVTAPDLAALGKPAGYLQRQRDGWRARYDKVRTHAGPDDVEALFQELCDAPLPAQRTAVVHNDYKLDNVVFAPGPDNDGAGALVCVLDWEMATLGCAHLDLATALAYWVHRDDDDALFDLPFGCTRAPGMVRRKDVLAHYQALRGPVPDLPWHYALANLKLATILQQLFFRAHQGFTADARFLRLEGAARVLAMRARRALHQGDIDVA